jgi:hypothetical protein
MSVNPSAEDLTREIIRKLDELKAELERYQDKVRKAMIRDSELQ